MSFKTISGAVLIAGAAVCYVAPASAVAILCEDPSNNHMLVDSAYVQSCLDGGMGNIGNGQNDDFLNGGGSGDGWTDITDQASATFDKTLGTFGFSSSLWDLFDDLAIGFKFGTGDKPDEWFVYDLQPFVSSGTWTFVNLFETGGGLSHITIYGGADGGGGGGGTPVPEPEMLALFGLGLLGLGFARRKRQ